jgi:hypothetical protein
MELFVEEVYPCTKLQPLFKQLVMGLAPTFEDDSESDRTFPVVLRLVAKAEKASDLTDDMIAVLTSFRKELTESLSKHWSVRFYPTGAKNPVALTWLKNKALH